MRRVVEFAWNQAMPPDDPFDPDAAREAKARRDYLANALDEVLERPLSVHTNGSATCVVLFGRMAFVHRNGIVSIALHDRGLLLDPEGTDPAVDALPIRPNLQGIQRVAQMAIAEQAGRALAVRRGSLLDLRSSAVGDWEVSANQDERLMEDALHAVQCLPTALWWRIASTLPSAISMEPALRRAARWVALGQMEPREAYQQLHATAVNPEALTPCERLLAAHALSASVAEGKVHGSLEAAVRWLHERLKLAGITPVGWRLLLDSPLRYWKDLHWVSCYDIDLTATALLIGQKLDPPALPAPRLARIARVITWEHQEQALLRRVPAQIWRTLAAVCASRHARREDIREIISWASSLGARMEQSMRSATFEALARHAYSQALTLGVASDGGPRYTESCGQAVELLTLRSVSRVARIMQNCLEIYWPRIEAGELRVFYALLDRRRAVISLRRDGCGAWCVDEVEYHHARPATEGLTSFADRLCAWCNGSSVDIH